MRAFGLRSYRKNITEFFIFFFQGMETVYWHCHSTVVNATTASKRSFSFSPIQMCMQFSFVTLAKRITILENQINFDEEKKTSTLKPLWNHNTLIGNWNKRITRSNRPRDNNSYQNPEKHINTNETTRLNESTNNQQTNDIKFQIEGMKEWRKRKTTIWRRNERRMNQKSKKEK